MGMLYKHTGFIFGIGVLVIERGLDIMDIETPDWVGSALLIIGGSIILLSIFIAIRGWINRRRLSSQVGQSSTVTEHPQGISNILSVERQEPSNLPPLWMRIIGILVSLLLLSFGGLSIYLVASDAHVVMSTWEWILFYLLFGVMPLWLLLEPFIDRKYYKSGKSSTAIEATFIVRGDINDIFNKCFNIIETIKFKITGATSPSLIKSSAHKPRISVELSSIDENVKAYVVCDANWVTVKVGKERNQRNMDKFQEHFIDEFRVSKLGNDEQSLSLTKALDWVTCDKCGFIGVRNIKTRELEEVEDNQRETGQPLLTRINSLGDTEPRHEKFPECLVQLQDFDKQPFLPLFYMQLPRQCPQFIKWQKGFSPKEHKEIRDRQPLEYGIQPIVAEPVISIDIDKCSVSNYGQSDQADNQC